jgi:serine/threonine-protein kinase
MEQIIYRCLEKDASKRYGSMNELLAALKRTGDPTMTDTHDNLPAAYVGRISSGGDSGPTSASIPIPASVRTAPPDAAHDTGSAEPSPVPSRTPGPFNTERPDPTNSDLQAGMPSLITFTQQKKSRATSYILVGLGAAAIAAVAFLSLRKPPEPAASGEGSGAKPVVTSTAATSASASTTAATSAPATSSAAAASDRTVHVDSEPAGASVSEDGKELCASTPCDVTFKDEGGAKEHKLSFKKAGYKLGSVVVAATDTKASGKLDAWSGGSNAAPVQTPGSGGGASPPKFDGCLDDSDCKGGRHCMHGWCK